MEQVRARHALDFARSEAPKHGANGGEAMKKIPPMILQSGLMAAIAFAIEQRRNGLARPGFAAAFDAIALHLCQKEIAVLEEVKTAGNLLDQLADSDSETLKLATAEALEWLGYARRFVTPGEGGEEA
ncbi:MAG: type III-B CRISPR module-associated protein Cmr5 [Verrucomicrobiales bacterium]